MKYYLAPLEGITTYIYRNAYHSMFLPMDKYFTPFLVPKQKKSFSSRERESNQGHEGSKEEKQANKKQRFLQFHDMLYQNYQEILFGERNVLFKMKEIWSYMIQSFSNYESYAKKIRKAETLGTYERVVDTLFGEQEVINHGRFSF